jgi:hypothetical protein
MSLFWKNWLVAWAVFVTLFGLVLAGGGWAPTDGPTRLILQILGGTTFPGDDRTFRISVGLMGAVTFGWGLTALAVVRYVAEDPATRRVLLGPVTMAMIAWFVVDSPLSILNGFALNAVSNVLIITGWVAGVTLSKPRGS